LASPCPRALGAAATSQLLLTQPSPRRAPAPSARPPRLSSFPLSPRLAVPPRLRRGRHVSAPSHSPLASPCPRAFGAPATSQLELRQQMARDDELLDLRRALVDLRDLGVAEVSLDVVLLDEAVAAVDLHRVRGHPHRGFCAKQLGHRRLGSVGLSPVLQS